MSGTIRFLLAISLLVLVATELHAQAGVPAGKTGASLELDRGSTIQLGLWRVLTERLAIGAEVGVGFFDGTQEELATGSTQTRETDTNIFEFQAGGSLKAYLTEAHGIAPYVYAHGGYRTTDFDVDLQPGPEIGEDRSGFVGRGALGVDWFATEWVSVGGYVGLRYVSAEGDAEGVNTMTRTDESALQTLTSGLILEFYF